MLSKFRSGFPNLSIHLLKSPLQLMKVLRGVMAQGCTRNQKSIGLMKLNFLILNNFNSQEPFDYATKVLNLLLIIIIICSYLIFTQITDFSKNRNYIQFHFHLWYLVKI